VRSRTEPLGTAQERRAVQLSVNCEVNAGLRRWDSRLWSSEHEARAIGGGSLSVAVAASNRVIADWDGDVSIHVDAERRSVNDARRQWQGVSDLPAKVEATRCGRDKVAVDLRAVSGMRRRAGRGDAGVDSVGVGSAGISSAGGWSVDVVRRHDEERVSGSSELSGARRDEEVV
jgi:hypothetical protein